MRMARPGPGKGWRSIEWGRQAKLASDLAHLILEELTERFDQL
jgi:hypothetical protein